MLNLGPCWISTNLKPVQPLPNSCWVVRGVLGLCLTPHDLTDGQIKIQLQILQIVGLEFCGQGLGRSKVAKFLIRHV